MVRLSRYILVLATIIAGAVILPKFYWMAFEKPIRAPFVMYSCTDNDFMIQRSGEPIVREDTRGNTYTREQYEEKLPLFYMRQLMISGKMLDTINGIEMDGHQITMSKSFARIQPVDISTPDPGLYPMFESESGRANLEMPQDFFRITWRMEFIGAKTNKVDEEKSRLFSAALYNKGFEFPATKIAGLPTTRKSCDEGYFVADSKNQLFHIKMGKGKPYVKLVSLPEGIVFKFISCVDFRDKKYYAYLIDEKGGIYILTQDDYELKKFPVEGYNPTTDELKIYGDLFHYNVIITGEGFIKNIVLDPEYKNVDEFNETWPVRAERAEGKIFSFLFPGQLSLTDEDSNFADFYFSFNPAIKWILFSLILMVAHFLIIRKRGRIKRHIADFGLILVTGVFGFIAVNFFPNKFFD